MINWCSWLRCHERSSILSLEKSYQLKSLLNFLSTATFHVSEFGLVLCMVLLRNIYGTQLHACLLKTKISANLFLFSESLNLHRIRWPLSQYYHSEVIIDNLLNILRSSGLFLYLMWKIACYDSFETVLEVINTKFDSSSLDD